MSKEEAREFEEGLAEITVACGFPLSWLDNPRVIQFFDQWFPGAKLPSRKVVTGRIIPTLVKKSREQVIASIKGQSMTLQGDGWTGINQRHVVAFMVGMNGKVYTVDVVDSTIERRTAEQFLGLLEAAYEKASKEMLVKVIGVVTNASGESAKARHDFARKHPEIIVLDCYAHQVCCTDPFGTKSY
ncbi:hypothetical protein BKA70DRAFT_1379130 [Coprinopsis sp. MPI-PUGE-AT-0042]|nr:hypothetical protein BKA70DRAFT_1379130 [Coprinopsis sp. MPI-PUGE-AT-0042]